MEQTTNEFILKWIKNARSAIGFQCDDDSGANVVDRSTSYFEPAL